MIAGSCAVEEPTGRAIAGPGAGALSLSDPWTLYAEYDWDDGANSGHAVLLPTRTTIAPPGTDGPPPATLVDGVLLDLLQGYGTGGIPDQPVKVVAALRPDARLEGLLPAAVVDQGWLEGTITDTASEQAALQDAADAWVLALEEVRDDALADLGGLVTVVGHHDLLPMVVLQVQLSNLEAVIGTDVLLAMDGPGTPEVDADGWHLRVLKGLDRAWDFNGGGTHHDYDGSTLARHAAHFEWGFLDAVWHPGFLTAPVTPLTSRFSSFLDCDSDGCTDVTSSLPVSSLVSGHATATMSAYMGDITRGTDGRYRTFSSQDRRSGTARGADVDVWAGDPHQALGGMVDTWTSTAGYAQTQVMTFSGDYSTTFCGPSALGFTADMAFLFGLAMVNSAGNAGDSDPTTCEIRRFGSSSSVFLVNRHMDDGKQRKDATGTFPEGMRSGGDGTSERTFIDLATYNDFDYAYNATGGYGHAGGTSISAPFVAGAMVSFADFYLAERSRLGDDPGILYANFLLMGDQTVPDMSPLCPGSVPCAGPATGYDETWGAGRLVFRTWSSAATPPDLDDAAWMSGRVCVRDGEAVYIPLPTPAAAGAQSNYFARAVARFTDPLPLTTDETAIALRLVQRTGVTESYLSSDWSPVEDKKRVSSYVGMQPGRSWLLRLEGTDVRGHDPFCGDNAQRVHFAASLE